MIVIGALLLGALLGVRAAQKRGGSLADKLQYGAAYAMVFAILGLFATILADRMLL
ncbi:hypothetical protein PhaeoP18_01007 [Phaeobacter piscinae]|uniref:Uncharacterized protein n=1 Tax=Phaeobacter piscinae TaxID=1580596 RepID=A0AAN1GPV7_9RHOB|nr:hypothetical protein [Phaeobacter piscinae]ATG42972.1 hypothetical protein PhaeoP13_01022 [Phaeobacter piscinae]AUR35290.1 hypothetical protein PhaeoP18_01007 [Phaeobacter piscinae]